MADNNTSSSSGSHTWIGQALQAGASLLGSALSQGDSHRGRVYSRWLWHEQQAEAQKQREWALNMWNKQNEYDSPAAQAQRLQDAGFSPLSVINGGPQQSQAVDTGSAASMGSLPQQFNSAQSVAMLVDAAREGYNAFVMQQATRQRVENETKDTISKIAERTANTQRTYKLLDGEIQLQGSTFRLQESKTKLTYEEAKVAAAKVNEIDQNISNMKQYALESQAKISLMSIEEYCRKNKVDAEVKLMMTQTLLNDEQRKTEAALRPFRRSSLMYSNRAQQLANEYTRRGRKFWDKNLGNQSALLHNQNIEAFSNATKANKTIKTDFLYGVDMAFESIGNVLSAYNRAAQGYMFQQIGKAKGLQGATMPPSVQNINPYGASYPSKRPINDGDAFSARLGGYMPASYFDNL